MTHDQIRELLGAYALYAVSDEEREMVDAHLATCADCSEEVARMLSVYDQLSLLTIEREPPPGLRTRLINLVELDRAQWERQQAQATAAVSESPRPWWRSLADALGSVPRLVYGGGGALLAAAVILAVVLYQRNTVTVHTYACAVAKPTVGGIAFAGASCSLGVRSDRSTDVAFNLPPLPANKVYELWLIPAKGNPVAVGGFVPGGDRRYAHRYAIDAQGYPLAAVTIERTPGNSPVPHGPIVVTAKLAG